MNHETRPERATRDPASESKSWFLLGVRHYLATRDWETVEPAQKVMGNVKAIFKNCGKRHAENAPALEFPEPESQKLPLGSRVIVRVIVGFF